MIFKIGVIIILLLLLIIVTLIFFYKNFDICKCINYKKEHNIIDNNNITVKQLFNQKNKIIVNTKSVLTVDGYISYFDWNYIDPILHNLIFQLKYISGLWVQNLTGKAMIVINNHLIIAQYKTSYDNTKGKMILTLVDENNKQLTASGNINIKLSLGNNKSISCTNVIENPMFNNINNAPTMCRNF